MGEAPVTLDMIEVSVTKVLEAYSRWWSDPKIKRPQHPDPVDVFHCQESRRCASEISAR